jgi:hypothetical protein
MDCRTATYRLNERLNPFPVSQVGTTGALFLHTERASTCGLWASQIVGQPHSAKCGHPPPGGRR